MSKNERRFRSTITFSKDEVEWLLGDLQEFYWMRGGEFYGQKTIISGWLWGQTTGVSFCYYNEERGGIEVHLIPTGPQAG